MTELTVSVLEEYLRDHYGTTVPEQSLYEISGRNR